MCLQGRPAQRNGGAAMADASTGAGEHAVPWWRFSLKQLLLATAFVALGCVALRSANATWVAAMFGLALLILVASLLLATYRDGRSRAFWVGFALFGWIHLLFPMATGLQPTQVITTRISHRLYDWLYSVPPMAMGATGMGSGMSGGMSMPGGSYAGGAGGYSAPMGSSGGNMTGGWSTPSGMPGSMGMGGMMGSVSGAMPSPFTGPTQDDFTSVAHTLWMLLLALGGGWFAQWLYATRSQRNEASQARQT